MKKKLLKAMALCLVLLFTATVAYAWDGNMALNSQKVTIACDDSDNDENEYDDDNGYDEDDNGYREENKGHKKGKNKGEDREEHKKPKKDKDKGNKRPEYVAVTGITVNKTGITLAVRSWERLTAAVQPANATDKKYYWFSDNPLIASVNPSGKVTGLSPGTAVIYAATRDGFKTASCTVTVTGKSQSTIAVTGVSLNKTTLNMNLGTTQRLTATVSPGNASNKAITWSTSNHDVVTVDQNGNVYAADGGTAVVTVRTTDGGKTATCTVTVKETGTVPVTSVAIVKTQSPVSLKTGTTIRLNVQVLPDNATNKSVTWSSSNHHVVTVDQSGNITGEDEGTATISVVTTDGRKTDFCVVEVIPADDWVSVTGIDLNLVNITLPVGFTDRLRYEIGPTDASNQEVRWSSTNPDIVSVNGYGTVEAKQTGSVVVTATTLDGRKTASCVVTAVPAVARPTRGILLNKVASTLIDGQTDYPTVLFYPTNDNYTLTWSSSDTDVATVNQSGRVTAQGPGYAVITVKTSNNWSASYSVYVVPE